MWLLILSMKVELGRIRPTRPSHDTVRCERCSHGAFDVGDETVQAAVLGVLHSDTDEDLCPLLRRNRAVRERACALDAVLELNEDGCGAIRVSFIRQREMISPTYTPFG